MKFALKWFELSLILNFLCLSTLIIHGSSLIGVKRYRNFTITWISFWPTYTPKSQLQQTKKPFISGIFNNSSHILIAMRIWLELLKMPEMNGFFVCCNWLLGVYVGQNEIQVIVKFLYLLTPISDDPWIIRVERQRKLRIKLSSNHFNANFILTYVVVQNYSFTTTHGYMCCLQVIHQ